MGSPYLRFWVPFVVVLLILGAVALHFDRRTLRFTAASVLVVVAIAMIVMGIHGRTYVWPLEGFGETFDTATRGFWAPLYRDQLPVPGPMGAWAWIIPLLVVGAGYFSLEVLNAKRESPRVDVANPTERDNNTPTGSILTELNFQLPAVELRKPATVPGAARDVGSIVASVVEASEFKGNKAVADVLRRAGALLPKPPGYLVRVCADECGPALGEDGRAKVRMTVDLRDQRSGRSVAVKTFDEVPRHEATARAAGFVATRLFSLDPSAPPWSAGVFSGEDLAAYLLEYQRERIDRTRGEVHQDRLDRIRRMEQSVLHGPASGIVRYELAALYELEGREVEALRLHALNRLQYKGFHRGKYRFASSLSMLAAPSSRELRELWENSDPNARKDIYRYLEEARLDKGLPDRDEFVDPFGDSTGRAETRWRQGLAHLAMREHAANRRLLRLHRLVLTCLWYRKQRSSLLQYVKSRTERRDVRRELASVRRLAKTRTITADRAAATGLPATVLAVRSKLTTIVSTISRGLANRMHVNYTWRATYNRACHRAIDVGSARTPQDEQVLAEVIDLLRRAVDDPDCQLRRPSEWIGVDPGLRHLHGFPQFQQLVEDQLRRDFDRPEYAEKPIGDRPDQWFEDRVRNALPPKKVSDYYGRL